MKPEHVEWLQSYKAPKFGDVTFFPGAAMTTGFGHDDTFGTYRWHNAVDRAGGQFVYVPFDCYAIFDEDYGTFGNLLIMSVYGADFEVRVAHFGRGDLTDLLQVDIKNDAIIKAGTPIGRPGNAGLSSGPTGRHTHTEIVSKHEKSEVCEHLLREAYGHGADAPYTDADFIKYCAEKGFDHPIEAKMSEWKKRGVKSGNGYKCLREDYHSSEPHTFYNSYSLFGF